MWFIGATSLQLWAAFILAVQQTGEGSFTPNAILIDDRDNVAVVIEPVLKGQTVSFAFKDGAVHVITALQDITIYHKIAVREIPEGSPVVKYGEHIGAAAADIRAGMHVHVHNVRSVREKL
jgi:altronate dehydratase small subunit